MKKGMITVIVIAIIVLLFIFLQAFGVMAGLLSDELPIAFVIIAVCVFLALTGAFIYIAYERIKEIKEEDKDDLSKY